MNKNTQIKKKYSIISTVYNDENKIIELLQEIENQIYVPEEVIIVDGGSNDNTIERIKQYEEGSQLNIKLLYGERLNIAQGLNRGIQTAAQEYIGIAMCGNHYQPDFFQRLYDDFNREDDIYVTYGTLRGISTTKWGKFYNEYTFTNKGDNCTDKFPSNHGNLVRKDLYNKEGLFYEKFIYAGEDTEYFIKIQQLGYKVYGDPKAIIYWETPSNRKEYYRQQMVYTIGDMELYNNRGIANEYFGRARYVSMWLFMFLFLVIPKTRILGAVVTIWLLYRNINQMIRYGIQGVEIYNLSHFVPIITMIKNCRLFIKKNKIDSPLDSLY